MTDLKEKQSLADYFLNNPLAAKFMTKFIIGKEEVILYGNPIIMSYHSELIKSLTELEVKSEYVIAPDIPVNPKLLKIFWLHLNGITDLKFCPSLQQIIILFETCCYFNASYADLFLSGVNIQSFNKTKTKKDLVLKRKDKLIKLINQLSPIDADKMRPIIQHLNDVLPEVADELKYIIIYPHMSDAGYAVSRLCMTDNEELIKELKKSGFISFWMSESGIICRSGAGNCKIEKKRNEIRTTFLGG